MLHMPRPNHRERHLNFALSVIDKRNACTFENAHLLRSRDYDFGFGVVFLADFCVAFATLGFVVVFVAAALFLGLGLGLASFLSPFFAVAFVDFVCVPLSLLDFDLDASFFVGFVFLSFVFAAAAFFVGFVVVFAADFFVTFAAAFLLFAAAAAYIYIHTHTYIHTHICTHTFITYTCTYTHTCSASSRSLVACCRCSSSN